MLKKADTKIQKYIAELIAINSKLQDKEIKLHAEITSLNVKCELLQRRVDTLETEAEENLRDKVDIKDLLPEEVERILKSRLERRASDAIDSLEHKLSH
jgi:chromosome segregation ATPase